MTKIRCNDKLGVDLNQVVAWSNFKTEWKEEILTLYLSGASAICISRSVVGCQAFTCLHKLLLGRFAIDLNDNNSRCAEEDDGIKLEDIPY